MLNHFMKLINDEMLKINMMCLHNFISQVLVLFYGGTRKCASRPHTGLLPLMFWVPGVRGR